MRITSRIDGSRTILHVDGEIAGPELAELQASLRGAPRSTALDLAGVIRVDEAGMRNLIEAQSAGYELHNASPYVALRLANADSPPRPNP